MVGWLGNHRSEGRRIRPTKRLSKLGKVVEVDDSLLLPFRLRSKVYFTCPNVQNAYQVEAILAGLLRHTPFLSLAGTLRSRLKQNLFFEALSF